MGENMALKQTTIIILVLVFAGIFIFGADIRDIFKTKAINSSGQEVKVYDVQVSGDASYYNIQGWKLNNIAIAEKKLGFSLFGFFESAEVKIKVVATNPAGKDFVGESNIGKFDILIGQTKAFNTALFSLPADNYVFKIMIYEGAEPRAIQTINKVIGG